MNTESGAHPLPEGSETQTPGPFLKLDRNYMQNCTYGVGIAASFFDPNIFGADIHVDRYESWILRKVYAYDDQEATEISWHRYLQNRRSRLALTQIRRHLANGTFTLSRLEVEGPLQELRKLDLNNEKYDNYGCPVLSYCSRIGKRVEYPEGWVFLDHLLPEMFEKWAERYLRVSRLD